MTIVKYIRPLTILYLIFAAGLLKAQQKEPVDFVDPFIGNASVMTAVSPPSKGGVARLLLFLPDWDLLPGQGGYFHGE